MFDRVGDDALTAPSSDLATVRRKFLDVNGEHPMTAADEAHVREHFQPATPEQLTEIAAGRLPLPGYFLADGTPMVADIADCLEAAGSIDRLHDWFLEFWPDDPTTAEREWLDFLSGQYVCLRKLNPLSIRNKTRLVEQARVAVDARRADPRDESAQGSLAEAVDGGLAIMGLDQILMPTIAYDRLRFGGPSSRDVWVDAVRAEFNNPQPPALPIHTERLTLRRTIPEDAVANARAWADPDFARYLLLPQQNPAEVAFANLQHSKPPDGPHRMIALTMEHEGTNVGNIVLFFEGTGTSGMEIGWTLHPRAAGQGLATEAARMGLRLAFEHYGVRRVVANLDALNQRSAAMCERLGMRREVHRLADFWSKGRWTDSYEYAILRTEWEAQQG
ncbi:MAG: GNAT family N-acetyltransferase [Nocardioides sp.]|uniref:GNAT family N-acetyltransferase n=1 Tax=Nocardioides sp. TaxID=35761 RepID=UPI003267612D